MEDSDDGESGGTLDIFKLRTMLHHNKTKAAQVMQVRIRTGGGASAADEWNQFGQE